MFERIRAAYVPIAAIAVLCPSAASADVRLNALFSDGVVLQRQARVPIWGSAADGEVVTVRLQERTATATARDGKWQVYLDNLKPGGPYVLEVTGTNTIQVTDVLVGDVWMCAGESNMEWPLLASADGTEETARARVAEMRVFNVGKNLSLVPRSSVDGRWQAVIPEVAGDFSAVAYYFGRELQRAVKVPVGIIQASWAGTRADAWTSTASLEREPLFRKLAAEQRQAVDAYVESVDALVAELVRFREQTRRALANGEDAPDTPSFHPFLSPALRPGSPANLYNGMIAPVVPFAIRGVLLYQGESNVPAYKEYPAALSTLIDDWRRAWQQERLPFVIVQLAPYGRVESEPQESRWAELRDAQLAVTKRVNDTTLVVTTDAGMPGTLNPIYKKPIGQRSALAARALTSEDPVVALGPTYERMRVEGSIAIVQFSQIGSGLAAKDHRLVGFDIAGADGKFVRAEAQIRGNTVAVWSRQVSKPVAVRYAWADYPEGSLMNRDGLPASPFRTR